LAKDGGLIDTVEKFMRDTRNTVEAKLAGNTSVTQARTYIRMFMAQVARHVLKKKPLVEFGGATGKFEESKLVQIRACWMKYIQNHCEPLRTLGADVPCWESN
jgi:hypothetical protein